MTYVDQADFGVLLRLAGRALREDEAEWTRFVHGLSPPVRRRMLEEFFLWQAHGGQSEPQASAGTGAGEWRTWLLMAARGFGKTLAGAQWLSRQARAHPGAKLALVGGTLDEVVKVMIEGPCGLLGVARCDEDMVWMPTRGIVSFASGAEGFVYSAAAPEKLRGPEHDFAWCDELAKWSASFRSGPKQADAAWDNLQMGLRRGERPRAIVTTTPRPAALLRRVRGLASTVTTGGRMEDNAHLSPAFRAWATETYGGTRLGRQELDGMLFDEPAGALWPRDVLEKARVEPLHRPSDGRPPLQMQGRIRRVVVGVDPPASAEGDACGIVVCGLGEDGTAYVLADCSVAGLRPEGWARAVARAAGEWGADRVIAEQNQGGDMVESVLRSVDAALPVRLVSASRGKAARAEPIAARFETGRAKLAGRFPELEDELAGLTTEGYEGPGRSPDRADAMVWAMTELTHAQREPRMRRL